MALNNSKLCSIIRECVTNVLRESASSKLYHFIEFYHFKELAVNDCFTPTDFEKDWFNGKNSMSFSRTKTFREGWPTIMYSAFDGKGDDWCAIRLTIDGDMLNRKSNFKVDGKRYNMNVKPFDWAYKDNGDGDPDEFADNYDGVFARNGKEWMMQSDNYTETYLPINYGKKTTKEYVNGISDKQGHPYSQAEDRLTTYANKIPNASQFITRVDILLLPYNFNDNNFESRKELYGIITSSKLAGKIHVYKDMRSLEMNSNEVVGDNLKRMLISNKNGDGRYRNPISRNYNSIKRDF